MSTVFCLISMVMSDFNLEWAAENFGSSQIVV
jgi:hypothetical protein